MQYLAENFEYDGTESIKRVLSAGTMNPTVGHVISTGVRTVSGHGFCFGLLRPFTLHLMSGNCISRIQVVFLCGTCSKDLGLL
jgi:hypothetical protein